MQNGQLGFLGPVGKVVSVVTWPVRKLNDEIGDEVADLMSKVREYGCVLVNNKWVVGAASTATGFAFTPAAGAAVVTAAEAGKKGCKALDVADQVIATLNPPGAPPLPSSAGGGRPSPVVRYIPPPPMYPPGSVAYKEADAPIYHVAIPFLASSTGFKYVGTKVGSIRDVRVLPRDVFETMAFPVYRRQGFQTWIAVVGGLTLGVIGARAWSKAR